MYTNSPLLLNYPSLLDAVNDDELDEMSMDSSMPNIPASSVDFQFYDTTMPHMTSSLSIEEANRIVGSSELSYRDLYIDVNPQFDRWKHPNDTFHLSERHNSIEGMHPRCRRGSALKRQNHVRGPDIPRETMTPETRGHPGIDSSEQQSQLEFFIYYEPKADDETKQLSDFNQRVITAINALNFDPVALDNFNSFWSRYVDTNTTQNHTDSRRSSVELVPTAFQHGKFDIPEPPNVHMFNHPASIDGNQSEAAVIPNNYDISTLYEPFDHRNRSFGSQPEMFAPRFGSCESLLNMSFNQAYPVDFYPPVYLNSSLEEDDPQIPHNLYSSFPGTELFQQDVTFDLSEGGQPLKIYGSTETDHKQNSVSLDVASPKPSICFLNKGFYVKFLFNKSAVLDILQQPYHTKLVDVMKRNSIDIAICDPVPASGGDRWCVLSSSDRTALITGILFFVHFCRRKFCKKRNSVDKKLSTLQLNSAKLGTSYTRTTFKFLFDNTIDQPEFRDKLDIIIQDVQRLSRSTDTDILSDPHIIPQSINNFDEIFNELKTYMNTINVDEIDMDESIDDTHLRIFIGDDSTRDNHTMVGVVSAVKANPLPSIKAIVKIAASIIDANRSLGNIPMGHPIALFIEDAPSLIGLH